MHAESNLPIPVLSAQSYATYMERESHAARSLENTPPPPFLPFSPSHPSFVVTLSQVLKCVARMRISFTHRGIRDKATVRNDASKIWLYNCKSRRDFDNILPFGPRRISGIQCQPSFPFPSWDAGWAALGNTGVWQLRRESGRSCCSQRTPCQRGRASVTRRQHRGRRLELDSPLTVMPMARWQAPSHPHERRGALHQILEGSV